MDLVEVVYGILEMRNISLQEFEELRLARSGERGGFFKALAQSVVRFDRRQIAGVKRCRL